MNDQHEIQQRIELLTLKARYLAAEIETATGKKPKLPALTGNDVILDLETLEKHCSGLEAQARTAAHMPTSAIATQSIPATDEPFLQRALRQNGCSTIAELKAKCDVERLEKLIPQVTGLTLKVAMANLQTAKAKLRIIQTEQVISN